MKTHPGAATLLIILANFIPKFMFVMPTVPRGRRRQARPMPGQSRLSWKGFPKRQILYQSIKDLNQMRLIFYALHIVRMIDTDCGTVQVPYV